MLELLTVTGASEREQGRSSGERRGRRRGVGGLEWQMWQVSLEERRLGRLGGRATSVW